MRHETYTMRQFRASLIASPKGYAADTITKRISLVRRYVSAVDWRQARAVDVEIWVGQLGLSPSGVRDAVSHVRQFYRWANRHELVAHDPTATVELPRARRRVPRPARDTTIAAAVAAAAPDMRAILALMSGCGLRCVEVSRLDWSDVDLLSGVVFVTGKGGHQRMLPLPVAVRQQLAAIDHPGAAVFVSPFTGDRYSPARISQLVNAHLRSVGSTETAHQLRHRYATTVLAACRDITVVRDLLGHSHTGVTEQYAKVADGAALAAGRDVAVPGLYG